MFQCLFLFNGMLEKAINNTFLTKEILSSKRDENCTKKYFKIMDIKIPKNDIPQWQKIHLYKICFITIKEILYNINFLDCTLVMIRFILEILDNNLFYFFFMSINNLPYFLEI